jgi:hypothetical protein
LSGVVFILFDLEFQISLNGFGNQQIKKEKERGIPVLRWPGGPLGRSVAVSPAVGPSCSSPRVCGPAQTRPRAPLPL